MVKSLPTEQGLSEERVEIGPLREATVCVTGLSGLDREAFSRTGGRRRRGSGWPSSVEMFATLSSLTRRSGSAEVTLDATLGLGRVCEDQLDVELTQGLANNGLGTLGVALFERDRRDRPGPLAKVARLVGVDGTAMAAQVRWRSAGWLLPCPWDETGHHEPWHRHASE